MSDSVQDGAVTMFAAAVKSVLAALETPEALADEQGLLALHGRLAALQFAATQLPHEPIDANDIAVASESKTLDRAKLQAVLNISYTGAEAGEPEERNVADDLADTYDDMPQGLSLFDAGYVPDAVWYWRIGYFTVWGGALAQAQVAIFDRLAQIYSAKNEDAARFPG